MRSKDTQFMQVALALAQNAYHQQEVPVGAVLVDKNNTIIATAHNRVEQEHTQAAHAEILAIQQAGEKMNDWRLDGCMLYVTVQPCVMCMALIRLSRITRLVYGADSPLFGDALDNTILSSVYKNDVVIEKGICADQATALMKQFFKEKRVKKGEYGEKI